MSKLPWYLKTDAEPYKEKKSVKINLKIHWLMIMWVFIKVSWKFIVFNLKKIIWKK